MYKSFILIGILLWSILFFQNAVFSTPTYILIWNQSSSLLSFFSLLVWIMMGFGIKWFLSEWKKWNEYEDEGF